MARIKEEYLNLVLGVNGDKARKEVNDLKKAISDHNTELAEARKRMKEIGKGGAEYTELSKRVKTLTESVRKNREELKKATRELPANAMTMKELTDRSRELTAVLRNLVPGTAEWKKYNAELQVTRNRLRELQGQGRQTANVLDGLVKLKVGIAAVVGAARSLSSAFNTIMDFEQANANLSTILGKNVKEITALTNAAKDLGASTEYTASQVTLLQTELAKLGFNEQQILDMEEPVLHFSTAVGAELPEAAALAGATLRIFGLQASDAEKTLSTLAVATNRSALDFSYLQTAMSIVGPVAKTFGFTVEDTTALLGTLANSGFDASSAATATRNILLNLADANGKLATAIGGPVRTFPELIDALKQLDSQGIDLAGTLELTDKRSVAAFNSFLSGADSANALRDALADTNGELDRIADERLDTVAGSIKLLQSAWEGLVLKFYESKGIIKSVLDLVTKAITALSDYLDEPRRIQQWIDNMQPAESEDTHTYTVVTDVIPPSAGNTQTSSGGSGGGSKKGKKSAAAWSLESDAAYLAARAELTRRYNEKEITSQEELGKQLHELEVATLTARLATGKEKGAARAKIELDIQKRIMKYNDDALKAAKDKAKKEADIEREGAAVIAAVIDDKTEAALAAEEIRYKKELEKYKGHAAIMEAVEKQHQNNLLKIRLDAEQREMEKLEKDWKTRRAAVEIDTANKLAANNVRKGSGAETRANKELAFNLAKIDVNYLTNLESILSGITTSEKIDGQSLSDEQLTQYNAKLDEVRKKLAEAKRDAAGNDRGLFSGTGEGSLFGVSQSDWEGLFANLESGTDRAKNLANILAGVGGAAQEGFTLASKAIEMTAAREKKEFKDYKKQNEEKTKALDDHLKAGTISQAQHDAEIEALNKQQEAAEESMKLRQAEREKRMNIVQAIINTSLGVTKTLAQWGVPAGIAPAAIMAALGAAQVAMMQATPVSGAEKGGLVVERTQDGKHFNARLDPDKRGLVTRPTVIVGENGSEYVVPHEALENPSIRPLIGAIEAARVKGRLKDIRLESIPQAAAMLEGRSSGGPLSGSSSQSAVAVTDPRLTAVLDKLLSRLEEPIQAEVALLGKKGLYESMDSYNRSRNRGAI